MEPDSPESRSETLKLFELLHMHYLQDLREFWLRSNFYLVAETAFVAVWASTGEREARIATAVAGIVFGLFWLVVARASVYWLDEWRQELRKLDRDLGSRHIWSRLEGESRPLLNRPSTITAVLPIVIIGGWIVLLCVPRS